MTDIKPNDLVQIVDITNSWYRVVLIVEKTIPGFGVQACCLMPVSGDVVGEAYRRLAFADIVKVGTAQIGVV